MLDGGASSSSMPGPDPGILWAPLQIFAAQLEEVRIYRHGPASRGGAGGATVHFTLSLVETRTGLDSGHDDDLCRNPIKSGAVHIYVAPKH
jgi:hypothetical protein